MVPSLLGGRIEGKPSCHELAMINANPGLSEPNRPSPISTLCQSNASFNPLQASPQNKVPNKKSQVRERQKQRTTYSQQQFHDNAPIQSNQMPILANAMPISSHYRGHLS